MDSYTDIETEPEMSFEEYIEQIDYGPVAEGLEKALEELEE